MPLNPPIVHFRSGRKSGFKGGDVSPLLEATIKIKLKKLEANVDELVEAITKSVFLELPITASHAAAVSHLPEIHRDPFDRILIVQAISEPLTFLTADTVLNNYSDLVEVID